MKFSVCIPTVNRIAFLRDALESVRQQANVDLEVVISENSGMASYGAAVSQLVADFDDLTIRVHHHPQQISLTENANFLIDFALGDALVHLPDDDMFCPHFLSRALDVFTKNPDIDFVFGDHWMTDADGNLDILGSERATRFFGRDAMREGEVGDEGLYSVAIHQSLCLQTMVCKKATMQRFRFSLDAGPVPDFDLAVRIATAKPPPRAYFIASRLVKYRQHGDQWTHKKKGTTGIEAMIRSLESSAELPLSVRPAWHRKLAALYVSLAMSEARNGRRASAFRHTMRALRLRPSIRGLAAVPLAVGGAAWARKVHGQLLSIRRWMRS